MLNECRKLEQINNEFANRIQEIEQKVESLPNLSFGKDTLKRQKSEYKVSQLSWLDFFNLLGLSITMITDPFLVYLYQWLLYRKSKASSINWNNCSTSWRTSTRPSFESTRRTIRAISKSSTIDWSLGSTTSATSKWPVDPSGIDRLIGWMDHHLFILGLFFLSLSAPPTRLLSHGDCITEALQTVDDFDGQLQSFSQWLHKIEQDLNYLEDYCLKSDADSSSTKQTVIELYQVSRSSQEFIH